MALSIGCANERVIDTINLERFSQSVSERDVQREHNSRAVRLSALESRGILSLRFPDPKNRSRERYEQGDLNLQLRLPSDTALVLKKLGETLIWLGSDDQMYWLFDDLETKHAFVGQNELVSVEKLGWLALPIHPHTIAVLLGLEQLPRNSSIALDPNSRDVLITVPGDEYGLYLIYSESSSFPKAVEIRDANGIAIVTAYGSEPIDVTMPSDPFGDGPSLVRSSGDMFPSKIRIVLHSSETIISFVLNSITLKRPREAAFSFSLLEERFEPVRTIDLDAPGALDEIQSLRESHTP